MSAQVSLSSRLETAKDFITRNFEENTVYFYTGRTLPWDDEYSPDLASSSGKSVFSTLFARIFHKKTKVGDTILAIKRFDWKANKVYTRADFNADYTDHRNWVHPESPPYVINSEGNVYKCISNNNGGESTSEPVGQSLVYTPMGDGYIWKFMFALTDDISDKFLTDTFIPVPFREEDKSFTQKSVEGAAVIGDIAYVHVDDGGEGYSTLPVVQIRGDGTGATATAIVESGAIKEIKIVNAGSGYTHATVHIFGKGNGAKASAMVGSHGKDAVSELGAFYVECVQEIISNEDNTCPITGTYRNIGLVKNVKNKTGEKIDKEKFNTLSGINIINSSGVFLEGETIIGEDSKAQAVIYSDPATGTDKTLVCYMVEGEFTDGEVIHGQTTGETGDFVKASSTYTDVDILSGDLIYTENIIFITRRDVQIERFVFTIEF